MYTDRAYTDKSLLEKFPFHGVFYYYADEMAEDGSYDLDDEDEDEDVNNDGSYDLDDEDGGAGTTVTDDDDADEDSDDTGAEEDEASQEDETETSQDDETQETSSEGNGEEEDSGEEEDDGKVVILETPCDIQQNTALFASSTITRGYKVYFPFDPRTATLPENLKPGCHFKGEMYGLTVSGTVLDPVASQLGGCMVEIRGSEV